MNTSDKKVRLLYLIPIILIVCFVFISSESLWIDEGNSAYKAMQGSIQAWAYALVNEGGSDAQMPLYMFYIWIWEKFSGSTEFALRLSNFTWLMIAGLAFRSRPYALVALLSSAFVLYYANELRPYLMQIAATAIAIQGVLTLQNGKGWWQVLVGCFILCGSSLTGVLWTTGIMLFIILDDHTRLRQKWFWKGIGISAPFFLLLGIYYLRSLMLGQQAASMGGGLITSMGAVAYELLGLLGLGPGRIELRANPKSVLPYMIILVPMSIAVGMAACFGAWFYVKGYSWKRRFAISFAIALPCLAFLALLFLKDFRVLGRHMAPLSVLITLCVAQALSMHNQTGFHRTIKPIAWCAVAFSLMSAISLRFHPRHARDDYKGAAQFAHQEIKKHREVIWAADKRTSEYYGISDDPSCQLWQNDPDKLPHLTGNETVILSKPDIYDTSNNLTQSLKAMNFQPVKQLPAFTIWQRP